MGLLFGEQPLGVVSEVQEPDTLFEVGLIGRLVPADFAQAGVLLLAPSARKLLEKCLSMRPSSLSTYIA